MYYAYKLLLRFVLQNIFDVYVYIHVLYWGPSLVISLSQRKLKCFSMNWLVKSYESKHEL